MRMSNGLQQAGPCGPAHRSQRPLPGCGAAAAGCWQGPGEGCHLRQPSTLLRGLGGGASRPRYRQRSRPLPRSKPTGAEQLSSRVAELLHSPSLQSPECMDAAHMLRVTEAYWKAMKDPLSSSKSSATVVTRSRGATLPHPPEFDVCVAGGNLGIFLALALQNQGHRVCIVEKRTLQGRSQEWNISWSELEGLVHEGLLSEAELEQCVVTQWDASRMGFLGGGDLWIDQVLNLGVSPKRLIAALRAKFEAAGGVVMEGTAFRSAQVGEDGVEVRVGAGGGAMPMTPGDVNRPSAAGTSSSSAPTSSSRNGNGSGNGANARASHSGGSGGGPAVASTSTNGSGTAQQAAPRRGVTCRLLVDCMGHFSPIVKQIRSGQRPDGMVIVLGGCVDGISPERNTTGDLLYTFGDASDDMQLFWEAFPAEGGASRTVYAFCYSDTHAARPSFGALLDTYLELLPQYQGVPLSQLSFKRVLFGGFPCYIRGSPLPPAFDRVLQVGDASAAQSPLSFGGFGAMVKHLPRLSQGVHEALQADKLRKADLGWLQPYNPSLSVSWLFQRSMSMKVGQQKRPPAGGRAAPAATEARDGGSAASTSGRGRGGGGWLPADHINRLMRCNFAVMKALRDRVMRPFVQDSMQLMPLALTMLGMMFRDPVVVTRVLFQVGPGMIVSWFGHFAALAAFTLLHAVLWPLRPFVKAYAFRRFLDALRWGSASDYDYRAARGQGGGRSRAASSMASVGSVSQHESDYEGDLAPETAARPAFAT